MKSFGTVKPEEMTREQLLESLARANEALGYFFEGQKDVTRKSYAEMNRFCIKGERPVYRLFPDGAVSRGRILHAGRDYKARIQPGSGRNKYGRLS